MGGHGWTVCHFALGFHPTSNTLDVTIRPMTRAELSVEYEGASWLDNRIKVIRGVQRVTGPFEVRINGGAELDMRTDNSDVPSSHHLGDAVAKIDLGDGGPSARRKVSPDDIPSFRRKLSPGDVPDSGVSLGRREEFDGGDTAPTGLDRSVRSVPRRTNPQRLASEVSAILATPTRPRKVYRSALDARSNRSASELAQLGTRAMSSSTPSLGGELFNP